MREYVFVIWVNWPFKQESDCSSTLLHTVIWTSKSNDASRVQLSSHVLNFMWLYCSFPLVTPVLGIFTFLFESKDYTLLCGLKNISSLVGFLNQQINSKMMKQNCLWCFSHRTVINCFWTHSDHSFYVVWEQMMNTADTSVSLCTNLVSKSFNC